MIQLSRARQLLECGYSLLTVGEGKAPNIKWKSLQEKAAEKDEFDNYYKLETSKNVGIITGYNNVECLDIDLKVLPSLKEQQDFWRELYSFLSDNIADFADKFVIYKTLNNGYHILYRCAEIEGNKKLASLEGHSEAIIETRGIGGYVFVYENRVGKLDYTKIKEISTTERTVLIECCKTYNYVAPVEDRVQIEKTEIPEDNRLSTWEDYNNKTNILDLLSDEFEVVRNMASRYMVKRFGATSAHSGYVYKNSGGLYLFSTGTHYPAEKLLTPFAVYAFKHHTGDFTAAARELYRQGYGDRRVSKVLDIDKPNIPKKLSVFPVDVFPDAVQNYILESERTLSLSLDYMGCSLLWMLSLTIGNTMAVEIEPGWREKSILWLSLIGKAGVGKTPSINHIIRPLKKVNTREIKKYQLEQNKYIAYEKLGKEEKQTSEEVSKPNKTQFIVNDITIEALVQVHQDQKKGIGVFKDELAGWFNDMNKYRKGSDMEFHLSSWSGEVADSTRKTAASAFVEFPFIPVLGGIQPGILEKFSGSDYQDSGFLDRLLVSYPDLIATHYNTETLSPDLITWWHDVVLDFFNSVNDNLVKYNDEGEIDPLVVKFSAEARQEWIKAFNRITDMQNSKDESEFFKTMLPKQKSYIPRFALIIHTFSAWFNDSTSLTEISAESLRKAVRVSDYFIEHAKRIKGESKEAEALRDVFKGKVTNYDKFTAAIESNPELTKKRLADLIGVSRNTIYRYFKKYKNDNP